MSVKSRQHIFFVRLCVKIEYAKWHASRALHAYVFLHALRANFYMPIFTCQFLHFYMPIFACPHLRAHFVPAHFFCAHFFVPIFFYVPIFYVPIFYVPIFYVPIFYVPIVGHMKEFSSMRPLLSLREHKQGRHLHDSLFLPPPYSIQYRLQECVHKHLACNTTQYARKGTGLDTPTIVM